MPWWLTVWCKNCREVLFIARREAIPAFFYIQAMILPVASCLTAAPVPVYDSTMISDLTEKQVWQKLVDEVRQQHAFLDLFTRGWIADYRSQGKTIHCGRGCSSCCTLAVNATFAEAVTAASELSAAQEYALIWHVERLRQLCARSADMKSYLRLHRTEAGLCPLIAEGGSCGIYKNRPLSCRSLLSTKESHWCTTDFAALTAVQKDAFLADLDRTAVAFPLHYVSASQEVGRDLETASNKRMREAFGFYLYGSFPILLFLVRSVGLEQLCCEGVDVVRQVLSDSGLDHPYLVSIQV